MRAARYGLWLALLLSLAACHRGPTWTAPGTTEWDRASVLAEVSEPIVAVEVHEGDSVARGQLLLQLDPRRTDAQLHVAQADVQRLSAQLEELRHGARQETIDSMRAQLVRASSDADNARRERERLAALRQRNLVSQQALDQASNAARMTAASEKAARAQLLELLHGTRPEQLAQAEAALAGARANAERLRLIRDRLDVRAPRAGRIDSLPYRLGDQPPQGAALVNLLVGSAPYARVYVPERHRAALRVGEHFRVTVDGIDKPFDAVLREVRSEASFTPYYALNGEDSSRLSYRAELVLQGAVAHDLSPGIPCHAEPADGR